MHLGMEMINRRKRKGRRRKKMARERQIDGWVGGRGSNGCVSWIGRQVIISRPLNLVCLHYNLILSGGTVCHPWRHKAGFTQSERPVPRAVMCYSSFIVRTVCGSVCVCVIVCTLNTVTGLQEGCPTPWTNHQLINGNGPSF